MSNWPFRADCVREGCGHSSDFHRLNDVTHLRQFRCLGYDPATEPYPPGGRSCDCPDMIRSEENQRAIANWPG